MNIVLALKALSNERRLQIIEWLKEPAQYFSSSHCDVSVDGVCVGLIEKKSGLSQSTISAYLAQMHQAGLIIMERRGQWTYCKLNKPFTEKFLRELEARI